MRVRIAALLAIAAAYAFCLPPRLGSDERRALSARFSFTRHQLGEWSSGAVQLRRPTNPSLARHSGWISAVGAAVALADVDGDGVANDVCHVDPRTDRVTVAPAPGTGSRYRLFSLVPEELPYDWATMAPMGCVPGDLDEDGLTDLLVYYWGRTPVAFLRRRPTRDGLDASQFAAREIVADQAEPARWYTNAATFADLDGDGHADLLIGNYFQDGARILDATATTPDSMQHSMSRAYNAGRNRLFLWRDAGPGKIHFEEVPGVLPEEADHAWTLAIGAADLDGDLLPEIYFANDFGPDRLFHNRSLPGRPQFALLEGRRRLTDPRSKVLGRDSFKGMGVDFADVDGDGTLDFFVSNIAADYALHESHFLFVHTGDREAMARGEAPYRDASEELGVPRSSWGWDTRFGDFDNDGVPEALQATGFLRGRVDRWPELQELATSNDELIARPAAWPIFREGDDLSGSASNPFYVQFRGRYHDLAAELGLGGAYVTRGIATADVDADGDLDFAYANQWQPSFLFRNETARADDLRFLGLRLRLPVEGAPGAGRPAVGASVRVERSDGRVLVGQVDGGNGHSGVRSPELHFGLGDARGEARVEIHYRDRRGAPARLELWLEPGWHDVSLPDAIRITARREP